MKAVTATGCVLAVLMMLVGESRGQGDDGCSYAVLNARQSLAVAQDAARFGGLMCTDQAGSQRCWDGVQTSLDMVKGAVQGAQRLEAACAHENSFGLTFLTRSVPGQVNSTQQHLQDASTSCKGTGQPQQCMASTVLAAYAISNANYQVETALNIFLLNNRN